MLKRSGSRNPGSIGRTMTNLHSIWLGTLNATLLPGPLAAQDIVPVRQLSFPLMDFGLVAGSVGGAETVAAPGVHSIRDRNTTRGSGFGSTPTA